MAGGGSGGLQGKSNMVDCICYETDTYLSDRRKHNNRKIFKGKTGIFEEADQRIEVPGGWNPGEWKTEESD